MQYKINVQGNIETVVCFQRNLDFLRFGKTSKASTLANPIRATCYVKREKQKEADSKASILMMDLTDRKKS